MTRIIVRSTVIVIALLVMSFMLPRVTHAASCYEDGCDGTHASIVGCTSGLFHYTTEDQQLVEQDGPNAGRVDGVLEFWSSSTGSTHCNTAWGTVYMYNTYATFLHVFTFRTVGKFMTNDDNHQWESDYTWPNYTTGYKDGYQGGVDDPTSNPDCMSESLFWGWDNSDGVNHTQGLGSHVFCTLTP